jgi:hypothetical protein
MSPGEVKHGLPEVPRKCIRLAQRVETVEGPEESLLDYVLGELPNAGQDVGEPERPERVASYNSARWCSRSPTPLPSNVRTLRPVCRFSPYGCSGAPGGFVRRR